MTRKVAGDAAACRDPTPAGDVRCQARENGFHRRIIQRLQLHKAAARTDGAKVERVLIRAALKRTQGHRQEAAKLLGWGRNTLTRKLKELGMDASE